jgi:hypothetical protein
MPSNQDSTPPASAHAAPQLTRAHCPRAGAGNCPTFDLVAPEVLDCLPEPQAIQSFPAAHAHLLAAAMTHNAGDQVASALYLGHAADFLAANADRELAGDPPIAAAPSGDDHRTLLALCAPRVTCRRACSGQCPVTDPTAEILERLVFFTSPETAVTPVDKIMAAATWLTQGFFWQASLFVREALVEVAEIVETQQAAAAAAIDKLAADAAEPDSPTLAAPNA